MPIICPLDLQQGIVTSTLCIKTPRPANGKSVECTEIIYCRIPMREKKDGGYLLNEVALISPFPLKIGSRFRWDMGEHDTSVQGQSRRSKPEDSQ